MHCPSCGAKASADQQFCRACGFGLEKVSELLAERLPAGAPDQAPSESVARLLERQRRIEHWLSIAAVGTITTLIAATLWAIIYKIIILKGHVFEGVIFLSIIVGAAIALSLVIYRESLREALTKRQLSQPTLPETEHTAKLLPETDFEPIPSVIEHTTELLVAEKERRRS
jgi:hypothetical protein